MNTALTTELEAKFPGCRVVSAALFTTEGELTALGEELCDSLAVSVLEARELEVAEILSWGDSQRVEEGS